MKTFLRERWVELLTTLILFALCCYFSPLVTDDYASFGWSCTGGQFSNYPLCDYYWGYIGLSKPLKYLYYHLPDYNWTGISEIIFAFGSLYLMLRTIKTVILKTSKSLILIRTIQILFALFFVENIIFVCATRPSLLLCGIALINLVFTAKVGKVSIMINTLVFILGMLIRPESGIGMLLIVSSGYLIYRFDLKHLITRGFFPAIAVATMSFAYYMDWSQTNQFIKKVEPEIEYKLMDKRVADISTMHTALDSIKYQVAVAPLCFDTRVLTPDYIRSLLLPGWNTSFKHIKIQFFNILFFYKYYIFIPCYYFALLVLCFFQANRWQLLFRTILFQIITFLVLYAINYTGGLISGRHFLNLQLISILILSFYFFNSAVSPLKQNTRLIMGCLMYIINAGILLLIVTGTVMTIINYKNDSALIAKNTHCYETAMQTMDNLYSNRIIILTTDNFHLFDHVFSVKNQKYTRNKYLMFDVWTYWLDPVYLKYIGGECACDPINPVSFFNWLSANKALYIAEPWRYDLTSKYMDIVHGQKLKFMRNNDYKIPSCINNTEMKAFELREVIVEP